jgi:DNA-binding transcriptional ArsR family regulator
MSYAPLFRTSGRASRLLKAMGNQRRLVILCHLAGREHSVSELCRLVGLSQSALSQHLAKLRRDNLVKTRRSAQNVFYSVASPEVGPILNSLTELFAPAAFPGADETSGTASDLTVGAKTAHSPAAWRKSGT